MLSNDYAHEWENDPKLGKKIALAMNGVGENGVIVLPYYDGIRARVAVGYVGENGIEPNVEYKVNNNGIFEKVNM